MNRHYIVALLLITLIGCATPYQKESGLNPTTGGYSDEKISENEYFITFRGNPKTTFEQVESMWNRRAMELCPNGYESDYQRSQSPDHQSVYASGVVIENTYMFPTIEGKATCK